MRTNLDTSTLSSSTPRRSAVLLLVLLVALLASCAPRTAPLPSAPLLFDTDAETLFGATLQSLATTSLEARRGRRYTFAIVEADPDTGLITAVREVRTRVGVGSSPFYLSERFRLGLTLYTPANSLRREIITLVVRPEPSGASLAYTTSSDVGVDSRLANDFMAEVVQSLRARFAPDPETADESSR
ncbi:MAG: hypothetical protein U5L04_02800 [Trueperaceae bacterium]|nr:hypothetical protein [Trueperaceae bacterium]